MTQYDILTFGETMWRFTPPHQDILEGTTTLDVYIGGSESNTAVGCSRLGMQVAWFSRLTNNPLGRTIAQTLRAQGVDTSHIIWTDQDRIGTYFVEEGIPLRPSTVLYDRQHSAMSRIHPTDIDQSLFQPNTAKLLHFTGITLALSDSAYATAQLAVQLAQQAGWQISFDFNYRNKLWSAETAKDQCQPFLESADIIFIPRRDACNVLGYEDSFSHEALLKALLIDYPKSTIVLTCGAEGAFAGTSPDTIRSSPTYTVTPRYRVGIGDAFSAGFLYGYLTYDGDLDLALRWGVVMAALKYSIRGDMPLIDKTQVEALVQGTSNQNIQR